MLTLQGKVQLIDRTNQYQPKPRRKKINKNENDGDNESENSDNHWGDNHEDETHMDDFVPDLEVEEDVDLESYSHLI